MIVKTIYLRWTNVPSVERPTESRQSRSSKGTVQMHKREVSRQSSLRAVYKRAVTRLIENLALPVPELSEIKAGVGVFVFVPSKMIAEKQNSERLLHELPRNCLVKSSLFSWIVFE